LVNKNVLRCLLKDGKEVNALMLVGRLCCGAEKRWNLLASFEWERCQRQLTYSEHMHGWMHTHGHVEHRMTVQEV